MEWTAADNKQIMELNTCKSYGVRSQFNSFKVRVMSGKQYFL